MTQKICMKFNTVNFNKSKCFNGSVFSIFLYNLLDDLKCKLII